MLILLQQMSKCIHVDSFHGSLVKHTPDSIPQAFSSACAPYNSKLIKSLDRFSVNFVSSSNR
uniref:Uncharacterized protein n=1 Tax=Arion vulgaris TaxID=1028688 RepID=A0A0B7A7Q2_9EUPU